MRSVVAEECHWTLLAYMEILDADRLAAAQATDERYHTAKLTAAAFNEPGRIWEEHAAVRSDLLTMDEPTRLTPELMARAAALWQRAREAEARHGAH